MPTTNLEDAARRELVYRHLFFKKGVKGTTVPVKLKPDMLAAIDKWILDFWKASSACDPAKASNDGWMMTRQEAIRWLIVEHLMLDDNEE
jgi:hypothetical protein